jgi:hypothetical protein
MSLCLTKDCFVDLSPSRGVLGVVDSLTSVVDMFFPSLPSSLGVSCPSRVSAIAFRHRRQCLV